MCQQLYRTGAIAVCCVFAATAAMAQTPTGTAFTYQGQLRYDETPVNGTVDFEFSLWNDPNSVDPNDQVGPTLPVTTHVDHGLFTAVLDFDGEAFSGDARWLDIVVDGNPLSPRQELTPAPYALYALDGGTSLWQAAGSEIYYNDGNVGIGISDPRFSLDVVSAGLARVQLQSGPGYQACLSLNSGGSGFVNLYSPADSDDLRIYAGDADRMAIDDAGNVGIGETDPGARLDVDGTVKSTGFQLTTSPSDGYVLTSDSNGIASWQPAPGGGVTGSGTAGYLPKFADPTTLGDSLICEDDGKVGIDIATPDARLELNTHPDVPSLLFSGGNMDVAWRSGQRLQLGEWDGATFTEHMRFNWDGNVGLGTSAPLDKFHVSGGPQALDSGPDGALTGVRIREDGDLRWTLLYRTWEDDDLEIFNESLGEAAMIFKPGTNYVGVGNPDPAAQLDVDGTVRMTGFQLESNPSPSPGDVLTCDAQGVGTWQSPAGAGSPWEVSGPDIYYDDGYVGIGTASPPVAYLHVVASDLPVALKADSQQSQTYAELGGGPDSWGPDGVWGVYGAANATDDTETYGGYFESASTQGVGVKGVVTGTGMGAAGIGVYGSAAGIEGTGGYFEATGYNGDGLFAVGGSEGNAAGFQGHVNVYHQTTSDRVIRLTYGPDGGGVMEMFNASGVKTVELDADEGNSGRGADVALYNSLGEATIVLDSDHGNSDVGRVITDVVEITGGSDLSEQFDVSAPNGPPEPGMVVVIDPKHPGQLTLATEPYDRKVAGVVSGANGVRPGMLMGQRDTVADGQYPVALTGRVWCWCDATYGPIEPGDLLTTSSTAGHAMKVADSGRAQGAILGKAMTRLAADERGLVLVLVGLQ